MPSPLGRRDVASRTAITTTHMTSQEWAEQLTEGENSDTVGSVRYEQSMSPSLTTAVSFRHLGSLQGRHNGDVIRAELGTGTWTARGYLDWSNRTLVAPDTVDVGLVGDCIALSLLGVVQCGEEVLPL